MMKQGTRKTPSAKWYWLRGALLGVACELVFILLLFNYQLTVPDCSGGWSDWPPQYCSQFTKLFEELVGSFLHPLLSFPALLYPFVALFPHISDFGLGSAFMIEFFLHMAFSFAIGATIGHWWSKKTPV